MLPGLRRGRHARHRVVPSSLVLGVVALGLVTSVGPFVGALRAPLAGRAERSARSTGGGSSISATPPSPVAPLTVATSAKDALIVPHRSRWLIDIPTIGVDAPVVDLGLNADGTLQVPSNFTDAGWYAGGPKPGQVGPAVIAGHVDSRAGPAVFYRLGQLHLGDTVSVWMASTRVDFVVQRVVEYPKAAFPTSMVYGPVDYPALRLITCGGAFNSATGHYVDNVIVFARLA
jgi:Sortase domain